MEETFSIFEDIIDENITLFFEYSAQTCEVTLKNHSLPLVLCYCAEDLVELIQVIESQYIIAVFEDPFYITLADKFIKSLALTCDNENELIEELLSFGDLMNISKSSTFVEAKLLFHVHVRSLVIYCKILLTLAKIKLRDMNDGDVPKIVDRDGFFNKIYDSVFDE